MCSNQIANLFEHFGWLRSVAGDEDFNAAINAALKVFNGDQGLLISGAYGCGKTTLMKIITRNLAPMYRVYLGMEGQTDRFDPNVYDYMGYNPPSMHVFIDDLGAERQVSEYGVVFDRVVEFVTTWEIRSAVYCNQNNLRPRRLFITTNLNAQDIGNRYGGRFLSRLKDMCVPLKLTGHDKRQWNI